jgi:broad specificity phosphatase PhoE
MRRPTIGLIISLTFSLLAAPYMAHAQQVVFLVRHAEPVPGADDPPLTETGQRRAKALAALLKDAGLTAIYVSNAQRTMQTAEPVAQALRLEPTRVRARDIEGLLDRLRTQHAEGRVLIVGHALTIPHLLKAFGHPEEVVPDLKVYDALYMIVPKPTGPPLVVVLRYSGG